MFIPFGPAVSYPYKPVKARISVDAIVNISTPSLGSDLFLQVDLVSFHNHFSDRPGIRDFAMAPTRTRQSENVSGTVLPIPTDLTRPASTCRPKHLNSLFQKSYGTGDHSVRPQLFILSAMLGDRLKPRQEKTAKSVQLLHSPLWSRDVRGGADQRRPARSGRGQLSDGDILEANPELVVSVDLQGDVAAQADVV